MMMIMKRSISVLVMGMILITMFAGLGSEAAFAKSKRMKAPRKIQYVVKYTKTEDGCIRYAKSYLRWNKVKGADGYQIRIKYYDFTSGSYKETKFRAKNKLNMGTVAGAGCGIDIRVKVRAYKIKNGKKVYGKWSKARNIAKWEADREVLAYGKDKAVA